MPPVNVSCSVAAQLKNARSTPIGLRLKPVSSVWFAETGSSLPRRELEARPDVVGDIGRHPEPGADALSMALGLTVLVDRLVTVAQVAREPDVRAHGGGDASLDCRGAAPVPRAAAGVGARAGAPWPARAGRAAP